MAVISRILQCFLFVGFVVTVIVIVRTFTVTTRTIEKAECTPLDTDFIKADKNLVARFQKSLTFKTISTKHGDARIKPELQRELSQLRDYIIKTYKLVHSSPLVKYEVIGNYSLLYSVEGSDPKLQPFLLMAHLDVVPVDQQKWDYPAFDAVVDDGFIYGRGTIDDKHNVIGILEAVEFLLKRGHKPKRSFYMAFGHDEEVRGFDGAKVIAETLTKRGLKFEFILDEGLTIINNLIPGVQQPVALVGSAEKGSIHLRLTVNHTGGHSSMPEKESCIGILASAITRVGSTEKGWLSLKLSVNTPGGHSSMPEKESSIGVLARAISRLETNPQPNMFGTGPEKDMFEHLAPYMKLPFRVLMSNLWLFGPLVSRFLSNKPSTNAIIRTTTAVTVFQAGIKDNVIPTSAWATVNHRVHPGDTVQQVIEYDKKIIDDDRVQIELITSSDPHPISPTDDECFGYQTLKSSILQVWKSKNVIVTPGVMIANTDTIHYLHLSKNIYRFSPTFMYPEDLKRFHGNNERISVENYEEVVNFYFHLIVNADSEGLEPKHEHGVEL